MDDSFLASLQKLEAMAFFSGYAIVYTVIVSFSGNHYLKRPFIGRIVTLLPLSYALLGSLFLGFQLKKLYPDYSLLHIKLTIQLPYLLIWGLLAMAFWIPALRKRPALSLIHSMLFFYFLASDLFMQVITPFADKGVVKNDMLVYGASVILTLGVLGFLTILFYLRPYFQRVKAFFIKKRDNGYSTKQGVENNGKT